MIIPFHEVMFWKNPPRVSQALKELLEEIRDWYVEELFTYIRVYGSELVPHIIPRYILERISLGEIANQIYLNGQAQKNEQACEESLVKLPNMLWKNLPQGLWTCI